MTTLSADKQAWADAHHGQTVEMALRGQIDTYTVLDDGRVAFHVIGGATVDEAGTSTFEPDGTEGTFIAAPPLSEEEVAAQLAAQHAEDEAVQAAREHAAADAQSQATEQFNAAVAAEVERLLAARGLAPDTAT